MSEMLKINRRLFTPFLFFLSIWAKNLKTTIKCVCDLGQGYDHKRILFSCFRALKLE